MARAAPIRRFWTAVATAPEPDGWSVRLDGRPVRTPAGKPLRLPAARLADLVRAEWQVDAEDLDPAALPLTRLAATAIDRVAAARDAVIAALVDHAGADVLCHRAPYPQALAALQMQMWQPVLDDLAHRHGVRVPAAAGLAPPCLDPVSAARLRALLTGFEPFTLTGVQAAAGTTGSLALALALADRVIDAEAAFAAAHLEETWQTRQWGEDAETTRRRRAIAEDLAVTARFLDAVRTPDISLPAR